jgi:hypothetical protein
VCVVASASLAHLRSALETGRQLAADRRAPLVVFVPRQRAISSDLAHAYSIPVGSALDVQEISEAVVRDLAGVIAPEADVRLEGETAQGVPLGRAVIVIAGRAGGLLKSSEQRLARHLEKAGHEVVFVPL